MLETVSPEAVYATKGNCAYPDTGGIDGTQTAAGLAALAQRRILDAASGLTQLAYGVLTSGLTAGSATTSLAMTGGLLDAAIPSGAIVSVISGNQLNTFATSAVAAPGATAVSVTSATPTFSFPAGSLVVYGEAVVLPPALIANQ
jgi:hypothetical protein